MPDTDGGRQYELQCLNDPGGIQDLTFTALDVPRRAIARIARVQPPGRAWAGRVLGGRLLRGQHRAAGPRGLRGRGGAVWVLLSGPEPRACLRQDGRPAPPWSTSSWVDRACSSSTRRGPTSPGCRPSQALPSARGRGPGQAGRHRRGELQAAAADPGGERSVGGHSRRPPGQCLARGARADAPLDDAAAGAGSRAGRRRRGQGGGRAGRGRAPGAPRQALAGPDPTAVPARPYRAAQRRSASAMMPRPCSSWSAGG